LEILKTASTPYDLVLLDWRMPDIDGLEISRLIRDESDLPQIPMIIMVTAHARPEVVPEAERRGVDRVLTKPIQESLLFDAISEIFAGGLRAKAGGQAPRDLENLAGDVSLKGRHVLLAEDNPVNQEVACALLEDDGLSVTVANDGREAVRAVLEGSEDFDAVLMDVQMPEMDGLAATREIRRHRGAGDLPILAMTAHAMAHEREKCLQAGMNDHIGKPVDPDQLRATLHKWLSAAKAGISGSEGETGTVSEMAAPSPAVDAVWPDVPGIEVPGIDAATARTDKEAVCVALDRLSALIDDPDGGEDAWTEIEILEGLTESGPYHQRVTAIRDEVAAGRWEKVRAGVSDLREALE
jgi:CheY-like chemotaxis protein